MLRIQDIADRAGVSRTTVSNVLHGKTKKVSKETIQKISDILNEEGYMPDITKQVFADKSSKIIGLVLGYEFAHGRPALQDPFVAELLSHIQEVAEANDYFVMIINGNDVQKTTKIASRWNVDGLIVHGYPTDKMKALKKSLNKHMVFVDIYPEEGLDYVNVGIDDESGGEQVGRFLLESGYPEALFLAETRIYSDLQRWIGFKKGMESQGGFCKKSRYLLIPKDKEDRDRLYEKMLPEFLRVGALAFSADTTALEAIKFLMDHGIKVPDQISIVGFDDSIYATMFYPEITTVRQDIGEKARKSMELLFKMIRNEEITNRDIKNPVQLIVRDSVRIR